MTDMELVNRSKGASVSASVKEADQDGYTQDQRDLIRLGKNPVLKRNFGFMQIIGFACTLLGTWEGAIGVSTPTMINGGPAGVFWGYIIVWIGSMSVYTVLSELSSMAPTAGGQYHWVSMLSPASSRKFLSFVTGWVSLIGWQATTAAQVYFGGTVLQSVILMLDPSYVPEPYQAMLISWAVLLFGVVINTVGSKTLAHFEGVILIFHVTGFFAAMIPLVYLAPHNPPSVLSTFVNSGGWSSQGLSFMVGAPSIVFCLSGVDSCVHMAEEVKNASTVVPRAIQISVILNGALGLGMIAAYVFCLPPLDELLAGADKYGYAHMYVLERGLGLGGGMAIILLMYILGICCMTSMLAATSRQMWSFARDKAMPFSSFITRLHPRTLIPVNTVALTAAVSVLLSFITLGSAIAFNNIVNLAIGGLYASYFIVSVLLLWRRLQGIPKHDPRSTTVVYSPETLQWGPWKLPEWMGVINNVFACAYLIVMWFFSFFPGDVIVTAENMNFSCLTFGGTVLFAVVWYFVKGRKTYNGPIVEVSL